MAADHVAIQGKSSSCAPAVTAPTQAAPLQQRDHLPYSDHKCSHELLTSVFISIALDLYAYKSEGCK